MVEDEIDENYPEKVSFFEVLRDILKDNWVLFLFCLVIIAGCTSTITRTQTEKRQLEIDRNILTNMLFRYVR